MHLECYDCVPCNLAVEETIEPSLLELLEPEHLHGSLPEIRTTLIYRLQSQFFMNTVVLLCRVITTARNDLIFKAVRLVSCSPYHLGW